jgi:hypothetical protein
MQSILVGCSEFSFTATQFTPYPHVHASQFSHPQSLRKCHAIFSTFHWPPPLSPAMAHAQLPFPQFDIPMRSTLPAMQFPPLF